MYPCRMLEKTVRFVRSGTRTLCWLFVACFSSFGVQSNAPIWIVQYITHLEPRLDRTRNIATSGRSWTRIVCSSFAASFSLSSTRKCVGSIIRDTYHPPRRPARSHEKDDNICTVTDAVTSLGVCEVSSSVYLLRPFFNFSFISSKYLVFFSLFLSLWIDGWAMMTSFFYSGDPVCKMAIFDHREVNG
jgi:hypothetical protein